MRTRNMLLYVDHSDGRYIDLTTNNNRSFQKSKFYETGHNRLCNIGFSRIFLLRISEGSLLSI